VKKVAGSCNKIYLSVPEVKRPPGRILFLKTKILKGIPLRRI